MTKKSDKPRDMAADIIGVIREGTKKWTRTIKAEERNPSSRSYRMSRMTSERGVSFKDAAAEVMERAYMAASDNNTLPANARQIMYAARPHIQERTGRPLKDTYFTQILLPDYIAERDVDWDVVYDSRGHFREPHTRLVFGLGTLGVRDYLATHGAPELASARLEPARIKTAGPDGCFAAVMFVEKEGFDPLWESVELAERRDLAIMSTKGMSVTACRRLADEMCGHHDIPLFVLHDFDKSGFSIIGTLREPTRRYTYTNEIEVIDMGLRMADIEGLEPESVSDRGDEDARRANLIKNGATEEEAEFLLHQRVELNAMTSRQLVDFVEAKLDEHDIGKVVPDKTKLDDAYRLFVHGREAKKIVDRELAKLNGGSLVQVPDDLAERVAKILEEFPATRWDKAVMTVMYEILGEEG
jgi:hypothetical protein